MTVQEVIGLISSVGFPIVFMIGVMSFIDRKVWPVIVRYLDDANAKSDKRHADFVTEVKVSRQAEETVGKMLIIIDGKLDNNHNEVLKRLDHLERIIDK